MSVEIWTGVCSGMISGVTYNTEVIAGRERGVVQFIQENDDERHHTKDYVVMSEAEAIDIALCILRELSPGFYQALDEKQ